MDMIFLTAPEEAQGLLHGFDRTHEVERVWRRAEGELKLVAHPYTEKWEEAELCAVEAALAELLRAGGCVLAAKDEVGQTQGFAALSAKPLASQPVPTLQIREMHVSRWFRHHGLGRQLFLLLCARAHVMGAEAVYISACSSEETVAFYRAMGCEDAAIPDPALSAAEPYDLQLVCPLERRHILIMRRQLRRQG